MTIFKTPIRSCLTTILAVMSLAMAQQQNTNTLAAAAKKGDKSALAQLRNLADKGDASAQVELGTLYLSGEGVPKDVDQAVNWHRKAAEQGNAVAQNIMGALSAKAGYADDAVSWFRKAAEQGFPMAQFNLGSMYDEGTGVPKDFEEAVIWYRKAAEQGYAKAQSNLGAMYAAGEGVPRDFITAYMWRNLAAAQGEESAIKGRDALAKEMTPAQIAEAQKLSREWKPKK